MQHTCNIVFVFNNSERRKCIQCPVCSVLVFLSAVSQCLPHDGALSVNYTFATASTLFIALFNIAFCRLTQLSNYKHPHSLEISNTCTHSNFGKHDYYCWSYLRVFSVQGWCIIQLLFVIWLWYLKSYKVCCYFSKCLDNFYLLDGKKALGLVLWCLGKTTEYAEVDIICLVKDEGRLLRECRCVDRVLSLSLESHEQEHVEEQIISQERTR